MLRIALRATMRAAAILIAVAVAYGSDAAAVTPCDFITAPSCSCAVQAAELAAGQDVDCQPSAAACQIPLPRTFPCPRIPPDNPITVEKIELGHLLFYDTRMSDNQTFACATCHQQAKAFTDGRSTALGSTGQHHPRSSMSVVNVAYARTLTWANPNETTLEHQAMTPMFGSNPIELGLRSQDELLDRLRVDPRYQRLFAEAFPDQADPINLESALQALGSFERTLISGNSPYDRFAAGEDNAISDSAKRGSGLFFVSENENCFHCHNDFNFSEKSDSQSAAPAQPPFHNTGLYNVRCADFGLPDLDLFWCDYPPDPASCMLQNDFNPGAGCHCDGTGPQTMGCYPPPNTGKYSVTFNPDDMGLFKPPTLRNIAVTAPYMHDGSIPDLSGVLDHYAAGGRTISEGPYTGVGADSPTKGQFLRGFPLNAQDRADLIAFLQTLTDSEFLANPHFADPFQPVACTGDCDLDGTVRVNELVTAVGIGLDQTPLAQCLSSDANGDGAVTIDELLRAVKNTLNGCS